MDSTDTTLSQKPALHRDGESNWMIHPEVLDFLTRHVTADSRTIETGAGYSTIVMTRAGATHTCVTPSTAERDAILAHCADHGIDTGRTTFLIGRSQDVLPRLEGGDDFDLALIDGRHGFPLPAVDYLYLAPHLAVGGHLLIDDVDIWTGAMVVAVLKREEGWSYEGKLARRTAVFRKTGPFEAREWCHQPTVVSRSRVSRALRQSRNGMERLLHADLAAVRDQIRRTRDLRRARARG